MPFQYERTESGDFKCPYCDFAKKNQSTVHMHIRAKHSGSFKYKCEHCDYETSTKQNLDNHIIAKHKEEAGEVEKDHGCIYCEFSSRTKGGLRSHYMLKHLATITTSMLKKDEKGCECTSCKEVFKSKPAFVYHVPQCMDQEFKDVLEKEVREVLGI
jgi:hypothetical protein